MQRYAQTREQSGELLRIALSLMSRHAAGLHPATYAVWYEYAAGTHPKLKETIDACIAAGKPVDDDTIYALHDALIAGPAEAEAGKLRAEFERMLGELSGHAAAAGEHADAYGTSLNRFGDSLRPNADPQTLKAALDAISRSTSDMRQKTGELQAQLQESAEEIQTLRAELTRARGEAVTDPLTGITNRRGFEQAMQDACAANGDRLTGFSLIMLDIDHFKKCNDSYGHLFGDKVICSVAQVVAKNVKGQDTPARIGGEEFAVLLPDTPLEGARVLAERIRTTVGSGRIKRGNSAEFVGNITVSLGVAQYADGETTEAFMARADKALYASKSGGRNCVTIAKSPDTDPGDGIAVVRPLRAANG